MSSAPLEQQAVAFVMEEKVDGSGQEENNLDDPSIPTASVVEQTQLCHHQDASRLDQDLPIMHWEDLSLRIAELEKQENEKRKKSKCLQEDESLPGHWPQVKEQSLHRMHWEDDGLGECRFPFITSRFNSPKKLQLCFINNTESDQEDDEEPAIKDSLCDSHRHVYQSAGLKQEVIAALSELRDKVWAEQRQQQLSSNDVVFKRRKLIRSDLQTCSMVQLNALSDSLHKDIQDLSSELVKHLVVRDHLRTKQDALLLDVQDMTSL
ncbi:schwannomin-interacting protein 1 isoform X2 [Trichomycterus rosablanca]|uniref:schwannomin-interacting protein 1 isoform X2 n=1 Tax=Trichomycterus rosablanca TaxID=2290929 RepID=UPI002F35A105